jgi:CHAD domain-containing protein
LGRCVRRSLHGYRPFVAPHVQAEREFKFEARPGAALPDLRPLVGGTFRHPRQLLHTAYFDSLDGRLWSRGLTLRHRTSQGDAQGTWTLKTPVSSGRTLVRNELSWLGDRDDVPQEARRILHGVLRREPLRQLIELETVRERLSLRDERDADVAELDDDLVTVSGGPRDGLRFRQVELELQGDAWSSGPVVRRLEAAGFAGASSPKLALAMPQVPGRSDEPQLGRKSTLADLARARLWDGFDRLLDHDWRLRLATPDFAPRDIHRARVATRRLRSDLKSLRSVLDPIWVGHMRGDLKWLGSALGEVRDLDVLRDNLKGVPSELERTLVEQRAAANKGLTLVLDDPRYLEMLDRLHAASDRVPLAGGDAAELASEKARDAVPVIVGANMRKLRRQVRKAGRHPSPERLHRIRIKAKEVRYASEFATPFVDAPARRLAKAARRLQDQLGEHHDAVAAGDWLRALAYEDGGTRLPGSVAFQAGGLAADSRRRQAHAEAEWGRSWNRVRKRGRAGWLRSSPA